MKKRFALILPSIIGITLVCCKQKPAQQIAASNPSIIQSKIADTLVFKDKELADLVYHTGQLLDTLFKLSPSNPTEHMLNHMGLNKAEISFVRTNMSDGLSLTEPISESDAISLFVEFIDDNLTRILSWKNIDDYNLRLLLKGRLDVASSPDGRMISFTFDEQTGGTYRSRRSFVHYKAENGIGYNSFDSVANKNLVFNNDGYFAIDTLHTKQGLSYVLQGQVMGCSTCVADYISLVSFKNGRFISDFNFSISTRNGGGNDNAFSYDAKRHIINIKYKTDDLAPNCVCDDHIKADLSAATDSTKNDKPELPEGTWCEGLYAFNGQTFVFKEIKKATK